MPIVHSIKNAVQLLWISLFWEPQTVQALAMLSRRFYFQRKNAPHPSMKDLGLMRVVAVVVNLDGVPEIGLSDDVDDSIDFYLFTEIIFSR
jgi:hypothetical protein